MRRLTISEMRKLSSDSFFTKNAKRFKHRYLRSFYYKGQNYIRVQGDRNVWYTFSKTGKTSRIIIKNLPRQLWLKSISRGFA